MAIDISTTTAATLKDGQYVKAVWLVEVDADAPSTGVATQRYAWRTYTVGAESFTDLMAGLEPTWARVKFEGGLASVSGLSLELRNEGELSDITDTYYLENDEVRLYLIFIPDDDSEDTGDKIQILDGVIESFPFTVREFMLDVIDGSDKDFRDFPTERIDPVVFPNADWGAFGRPLPVCFGTLNTVPQDFAGGRPTLAPCVCTDIFTREYTPGRNLHTKGDVYQYYGGAGRSAMCLSVMQSGDFVTINDGTRSMVVYPVRDAGTNDVTGWSAVADNDLSTDVDIVNNDNLDVYMGGVSKLGTLTAVTLTIKASGGYDYDVLLGGVSLDSGSTSGDKVVTLTSDIAANWADTWDFERMSVEIDGTGAASIELIYLTLSYDDADHMDARPLDIHQAVSGFRDTASFYADGADGSVIVGDGTLLENPVDILEAMFRGKDMLGLLEADIDLASFGTARTFRTDWKLAFSLRPEVGMDWVDQFASDNGLHIYKGHAGKWRCVAQDKTTAASHTILGDVHIAVRDHEAEQLEPDLRISRTPLREVVNEVAIRYALDRQSSEHTQLTVASGRYRITGTCAVTEQAGGSQGTLTDDDGGRDFAAEGVLVGERVYVDGDQDYEVVAVGTTTLVLDVIVSGEVQAASAGTSFWVGPNVDGRMIRSQQRHKTENALGTAQKTFSDVGGYPSDIINDSDTVGEMVNHVVEYRSRRRLTAEFATFLNAVDMELGDAAYFDHAWVPPSFRPAIGSFGSLDGAVNDSTTTFVLQSTQAAAWRADDHGVIDNEIFKVTATDENTTLTVDRAQAGSIAAAHVDGSQPARLAWKWEVTGLKPDPAAARWRVEVQLMPRDVGPTGICVANGGDDYAAADILRKLSAGWCTTNIGLVDPEDEGSDYSHAGAN